MSVLSLSQIVGGNHRSLYQLGERVRSAVSDISKAADSNIASSQDSASVSSQRLQARVSGFREAAQDIARNVGELSLTARGSETIASKLAELEALAAKALQQPEDADSLKKLDDDVQKIRANIDQIARQSQFTPPGNQEAKKAGNETAKTEALQIKLNSEALLGAKTDITSSADIRNLITAVQNAAGKLGLIQDDIKSMFESYEMMAVHLEVSMENQIAANSFVPSDDALSALELLLGQPNDAIAAQTGKLPANLLNLL